VAVFKKLIRTAIDAAISTNKIIWIFFMAAQSYIKKHHGEGF